MHIDTCEIYFLNIEFCKILVRKFIIKIGKHVCGKILRILLRDSENINASDMTFSPQM